MLLQILKSVMPLAVGALESKYAPLRQMAARFLSEMCCVDPLAGHECLLLEYLESHAWTRLPGMNGSVLNVDVLLNGSVLNVLHGSATGGCPDACAP